MQKCIGGWYEWISCRKTVTSIIALLSLHKKRNYQISALESCTQDNDCTRKSCGLFHITLYQNPTITSPRGGGERGGSVLDAFKASPLSFQLRQSTANASALGKSFTKKFHAETESTHLFIFLDANFLVK